MIEPCRACGAQNRIPTERLNQHARCGTCMRAILPLNVPHPVHSAAEFDELLRGSPLTLVVDFWAPWCGPCRNVAPEVEKLARARSGGAVVLKLNTEEVPEVAERYGICSIPTFVVFRGGRERTRFSGAMPASELATRTAD